MKGFLLFATIVCIAACNNEAKKETTSADTTGSDTAKYPLQSEMPKKGSQAVDPDLWKIDNEVANKMKLFLNGCTLGCKNKSVIIDYNKPVYDAIQAKYPSSKIVEVQARY